MYISICNLNEATSTSKEDGRFMKLGVIGRHAAHPLINWEQYDLDISPQIQLTSPPGQPHSMMYVYTSIGRRTHVHVKLH